MFRWLTKNLILSLLSQLILVSALAETPPPSHASPSQKETFGPFNVKPAVAVKEDPSRRDFRIVVDQAQGRDPVRIGERMIVLAFAQKVDRMEKIYNRMKAQTGREGVPYQDPVVMRNFSPEEVLLAQDYWRYRTYPQRAQMELNDKLFEFKMKVAMADTPRDIGEKARLSLEIGSMVAHSFGEEVAPFIEPGKWGINKLLEHSLGPMNQVEAQKELAGLWSADDHVVGTMWDLGRGSHFVSDNILNPYFLRKAYARIEDNSKELREHNPSIDFELEKTERTRKAHELKLSEMPDDILKLREEIRSIGGTLGNVELNLEQLKVIVAGLEEQAKKNALKLDAAKTPEEKEKINKETLQIMGHVKALLGVAQELAGNNKDAQATVAVLQAGAEISSIVLVSAGSGAMSAGIGTAVVLLGYSLYKIYLQDDKPDAQQQVYEEIGRLERMVNALTVEMRNQAGAHSEEIDSLRKSVKQQFDFMKQLVSDHQELLVQRTEHIETKTGVLEVMMVQLGNQMQKQFMEQKNSTELDAKAKLLAKLTPADLEKVSHATAGKTKAQREERIVNDFGTKLPEDSFTSGMRRFLFNAVYNSRGLIEAGPRESDGNAAEIAGQSGSPLLKTDQFRGVYSEMRSLHAEQASGQSDAAFWGQELGKRGIQINPLPYLDKLPGVSKVQIEDAPKVTGPVSLDALKTSARNFFDIAEHAFDHDPLGTMYRQRLESFEAVNPKGLESILALSYGQRDAFACIAPPDSDGLPSVSALLPLFKEYADAVKKIPAVAQKDGFTAREGTLDLRKKANWTPNYDSVPPLKKIQPCQNFWTSATDVSGNPVELKGLAVSEARSKQYARLIPERALLAQQRYGGSIDWCFEKPRYCGEPKILDDSDPKILKVEMKGTFCFDVTATYNNPDFPGGRVEVVRKTVRQWSENRSLGIKVYTDTDSKIDVDEIAGRRQDQMFARPTESGPDQEAFDRRQSYAESHPKEPEVEGKDMGPFGRVLTGAIMGRAAFAFLTRDHGWERLYLKTSPGKFAGFKIKDDPTVLDAAAIAERLNGKNDGRTGWNFYENNLFTPGFSEDQISPKARSSAERALTDFISSKFGERLEEKIQQSVKTSGENGTGDVGGALRDLENARKRLLIASWYALGDQVFTDPTLAGLFSNLPGSALAKFQLAQMEDPRNSAEVEKLFLLPSTNLLAYLTNSSLPAGQKSWSALDLTIARGEQIYAKRLTEAKSPVIPFRDSLPALSKACKADPVAAKLQNRAIQILVQPGINPGYDALKQLVGIVGKNKAALAKLPAKQLDKVYYDLAQFARGAIPEDGEASLPTDLFETIVTRALDKGKVPDRKYGAEVARYYHELTQPSTGLDAEAARGKVYQALADPKMSDPEKAVATLRKRTSEVKKANLRQAQGASMAYATLSEQRDQLRALVKNMERLQDEMEAEAAKALQEFPDKAGEKPSGKPNASFLVTIGANLAEARARLNEIEAYETNASDILGKTSISEEVKRIKIGEILNPANGDWENSAGGLVGRTKILFSSAEGTAADSKDQIENWKGKRRDVEEAKSERFRTLLGIFAVSYSLGI